MKTIRMIAKTIRVTRTNYDRFEGDGSDRGSVFSSAKLREMRLNGFRFIVTDATPADCGTWELEPLEGIDTLV